MQRREVVSDCVYELRRLYSVDTRKKIACFDLRIILIMTIILMSESVFGILEE
jgi:hypothetical protein